MIRAADSWSVPRRALASSVLVLALLASHAALAWASPWLSATALFADAIVRLPVRPLEWVTHDPTIEETRWAVPGDVETEGRLVLPDAAGPSPAIVLVLGAQAAPPDDPRVARLTDSLARLGWAVLLPRSEDLDAGRVLPSEPPRLVAAFQHLRAEPRVRPDRIGFVGLSAGASLSLVAASDPAIARDVAFVVAIGPYFDAGTLVADAVAGAFRMPDGAVVPWSPRRITREAIASTLRALAPEGDPERGAVEALLAGLPLGRAEAAVAGLDGGVRAALEAVSPRYHVAGLRAPLYLLHDRHDEFVPWVESEALVEAVHPRVFHLLDLFEHVDPHLTSVRPLLRDGWRLVRLFAALFDLAR